MEASSKDKSSAVVIQASTAPEKSALLPQEQIRTYWWRWLVLGILMSNTILSYFLWITFAPVADVMRCYYSISNDIVNALSLVNVGLILFLVLPSAWCLRRFGLRFTLILSSIASALGAGIRVMGAGAGYFSLLMIGQIVSAFNGLLEGGYTLFSEVWFSPSERAMATALSASIAPQVRERVSACTCIYNVLYWGSTVCKTYCWPLAIFIKGIAIEMVIFVIFIACACIQGVRQSDWCHM